MTDDPTAPTTEIADAQSQANIDLQMNGSGTTITPWGREVFMESIGSSIHGKSTRPKT